MKIGFIIKKIIVNTYNTIYWLLHFREQYIVINATCCIIGKKVIKTNFGDDLNLFLIREMTGVDYIINQSDIFIKFKQNLVPLGSIIEWKTRKNSVIWGAGAMYGDENRELPCPIKVCAVRGKLTYNYLREKGWDVPAVFGDPALLLPKYYQPSRELKKENKVGIIPHYIDQMSVSYKNFYERYKSELEFIDLKDYDTWHNVIDKITSCKFIISSSLHGLIVADAYGIPNIWVKFGDNIAGGDFKYHDYFSSVGKNIDKPCQIAANTTLSDILEEIKSWKPIDIDLHGLIDAFPNQGLKNFSSVCCKN